MGRMLGWLTLLPRLTAAILKSRRNLLLENLALRRQLRLPFYCELLAKSSVRNPVLIDDGCKRKLQGPPHRAEE